jgi:hypothetical protein
MSSTDPDAARKLAGQLFDEILVPLGDERHQAGRQEYFPLAGDTGAKTYYDQPLLAAMQPDDFEFPGGGTVEGLVDALAASWSAQGDAALAAIAPKLKAIAEELKKEAAVEQDGNISILCYTLY